MKESHFLLRRTAGYSKFSSLLSLLMQFYFMHQNYQNCQLTKKTVCFCSQLSTNHIFDVLSLGLSFQLLLFRVALGVMKNETSRFYPFVCMRNILHKACAVCISQPEDIFYCIYLCLWQMATLLYFISLILSWTALLLTALSLILISYCMGVFCGQNFEREYIDVLLNKLLLCVIIRIRKWHKSISSGINQLWVTYIDVV